jgi:hypothetical protein
LTLAAIAATAHGMWSGTTQGAGSGSVQIELWQVINLLGAPILALLFAQPVIDDLKAWIKSTRDAER